MLSFFFEQLFYLEECKKTILYFNPDDIIVINKRIILFVNFSLVKKFDLENKVYFETHFPFSQYSAPEIINSESPYFYYTFSYYSLCAMFLKLFNIHNINYIYSDRLYFLFKNAMNLDPLKRFLLY